MLTSVIGMVVLLGGLIFFHEFGHYSVAKFFGVKVEVFSLGFGKKIFSKIWGETEYCLSLFPLGGYVKLMGDDPYKGVPADQAERAFCTQKLYKRFAIVAAGPLANLLLAFVLFIFIFAVGKPVASSKIGQVQINSQAWNIGLRARDRIVDIDGTPVKTWSELEETLEPLESKNVVLGVLRQDARLEIPVDVQRVESKNVYGEDVMVGGIKGITPNPLQAMVGVTDVESPAYVAGLRTGDVVRKVGNRVVEQFEELNDELESAWKAGEPITLTVGRPLDAYDPKSSIEEQSFSVTFPKLPSLENRNPLGVATELGLFPSELMVYQVTPESPAEKGGLRPGDRIVKIDETPIYSFQAIVDLVQKKGESDGAVNLSLERDGRAVVLNLKPEEVTREDPLTRQDVSRYLIGFAPRVAYREADMHKLQVAGFVPLIGKAWSETQVLSERMVISLWKLVVGEISVKNLGGPVLIATVAGKSLDAGIVPFLQMMALISINLFLLNLFPIPILDGGHLLFFTIEAIKGKPVSIRTMEIANQLGMVFILMLVGLTLFNDITRIVLN